jgi:chemotaxis protein MotB
MKSKLAAKEKAMQDIKTKMSEALLTLNNSELQVTEKEGKVYVVLPNRTLFGTGSYALHLVALWLCP